MQEECVSKFHDLKQLEKFELPRFLWSCDQTIIYLWREEEGGGTASINTDSGFWNLIIDKLNDY